MNAKGYRYQTFNKGKHRTMYISIRKGQALNVRAECKEEKGRERREREQAPRASEAKQAERAKNKKHNYPTRPTHTVPAFVK